MTITQESEPLVSAAVIVFNQCALVVETLDSIAKQDYRNLEIVVADDGSTDGTQAVLREYALRCSRPIKLIFSPINRGITANSNAALAACSGDYIAWCGGDDLWLPGKARRQAAALQSCPGASLSYHPVAHFDSETGAILEIDRPPVDRNLEARDLVLDFFFHPISAMHRRAAIPHEGFRPELSMASDWLFLIEVAFYGPLVPVPAVLAGYRRHEQQVTSRPETRRIILRDTLETTRIVRHAHPDLAEETRGARSIVLLEAADGLKQAQENDLEVLRMLLRSAKADPFGGPGWDQAWRQLARMLLPSPALRAIRRLRMIRANRGLSIAADKRPDASRRHHAVLGHGDGERIAGAAERQRRSPTNDRR